MQHDPMPVNFVATPYGRVACREIGNGPVAVFLHGLPLSGREWREVLAALAGLRRCIAIDQLGLGETEPVEEVDLGYAGQADMLAACLDSLGVEQVDLVGNDTGGGIAQLFLARHGARLRSLTLTIAKCTTCGRTRCWGFYDGVPRLRLAVARDAG
ncbi:MAG: alpha/beta fold hydrolase [Anaerolineae bacterium]|nr:alpha/beta fold hydrolase [Anaerolineae bacterium]